MMRPRMIVLHIDRLPAKRPGCRRPRGPRPLTDADTVRGAQRLQIALDLFRLVLPAQVNGSKMGAMRRVIATCCICWLAWCGAPRSNNLPLAFGMTPAEAEFALGQPLLYHSGRHGSEI